MEAVALLPVNGAFAPFESKLPGILSEDQTEALREAMQGRPLALCFGAGVDSTAMMVAFRAAGIRPDVITFADTGGEKKATLAHLDRMRSIVDMWGWPAISVVKKKMLPTTPYSDLYGNCWANETLPSLAFGMKSCSIKYKVNIQDQFIKGAKRGPNAQSPHILWTEAKAKGLKIVKAIGYDCSKADRRRSGAIPATDKDFDYIYPLQLLGWARGECVAAIAQALGPEFVPEKSSCTFCPASKVHELFWLAAHEPDALERALRLEHRALTGKHSRFDSVEFGASWEQMIRTADRFPSTSTCVGLGRSFSWCQWALNNRVADEAWTVDRSESAKERFLEMANTLRGDDNALDARSISISGDINTIHIIKIAGAPGSGESMGKSKRAKAVPFDVKSDDERYSIIAEALPHETSEILDAASKALYQAADAIDRGDMETARQLYEYKEAAVWKLNGKTFFGCKTDTGASTLIDKHCAAAPGTIPVWTQNGEFIINSNNGRALVKYGACNPDGLASIEFFAIDLNKAFISETGYRSTYARVTELYRSGSFVMAIKSLFDECYKKEKRYIKESHRARLANEALPLWIQFMDPAPNRSATEETVIPAGYERVDVILPAYQAFIVRRWASAAEARMKSETGSAPKVK